MLKAQLPEKDQEPVALETPKPAKTPFQVKKAAAEVAREKAVISLSSRLGYDQAWYPETMEMFFQCIFCGKIDVRRPEENFVCRVCAVTLTVADTS